MGTPGLKNVIIVGLVSTVIALLAVIVYLQQRGPVEKDKIVYVDTKTTSIGTLEEELLELGVTNAWIETYSNIKADCFQTELLNHRHLFRYCKLRQEFRND